MSSKPYPILKLAGDSALMIIFGEKIDLEINQKVHALDKLIQQNPLTGIIETIPTYVSLLLHFDPCQLNAARVSDWLQPKIKNLSPLNPENMRLIKVPVRYGSEYGPDLAFVAEHNQLSINEVIQIHASREYPVYMMGFTPGFPYLGGMDERIAAPRLSNPRTHVPAGSVGIAGKQTGIYPIDSPGGWQIIGRTDKPLFDVKAEQSFLLSPGDRIKFVPIEVQA